MRLSAAVRRIIIRVDSAERKVGGTAGSRSTAIRINQSSPERRRSHIRESQQPASPQALAENRWLGMIGNMVRCD